MKELEKKLAQACEVVLSGGVVVIPTETFYGLAADPFNEAAVLKIFQIKFRHHSKPLPLIASDMAAVEQLASKTSPETSRLIDRYWPGSLTVLMKTEARLPKLLTNEEGKVGVRIPPLCAARTLARLVGGLITATSANLSGEPNPTTVRMISPKVIAAADLVVDLGPTPGGKPSTVIDFEKGKVRVVRDGAVSKNEIETFLLESESS